MHTTFLERKLSCLVHTEKGWGYLPHWVWIPTSGRAGLWLWSITWSFWNSPQRCDVVKLGHSPYSPISEEERLKAKLSPKLVIWSAVHIQWSPHKIQTKIWMSSSMVECVASTGPLLSFSKLQKRKRKSMLLSHHRQEKPKVKGSTLFSLSHPMCPLKHPLW